MVGKSVHMYAHRVVLQMMCNSTSGACMQGILPWKRLMYIYSYIYSVSMINPLTFVSHCSGFKLKLTFQFFGSSLFTRQILGILCLQIDLFLIVDCIYYI